VIRRSVKVARLGEGQVGLPTLRLRASRQGGEFHAGTQAVGQGMVEYALILVLVSIVVIVILLTMGGQIANVFSNIVTALNG
jgi:pilus assembly protein Flp/PilA